ncbi:MAG: endolytic transglycosylase MltG, partial [Gemmiger sp.]|nr:endolytic transglycosylase MltG [Gemmiger sp.]
GMPYNDMLKTLSVQQVHRKTISVTFPEGYTSVAIAQKMEEQGLCTAAEFLACANGEDGSDFSKYDFWTQIPQNNGRIMKCEGYLFPDTYEFFTDDTVYNYVDTFYKQFNAKTADLAATIAEKGTTIDNVVILASFIQEEAGKAEEDAKVSAVFHNRLETDNPLWSAHMLESNASSYIMNDGDNNYLWNSPVAEYMGWVAAGAIPEDVLNAYDTYRVSGLPAGPISSPGYDAILAALNPDEAFMAEGYFFFVTGNPNGDHPGEYFYAKTADEHYQNCITAGWA